MTCDIAIPSLMSSMLKCVILRNRNMSNEYELGIIFIIETYSILSMWYIMSIMRRIDK